MIVTTVIYTIVGGLIAILGYILLFSSKKGEKGWKVFGGVLLLLGVLITLAAEWHFYQNASQEELIKWMFWMKD